MITFLRLCFLALITGVFAFLASAQTTAERVWPRPVIIPLTDQVSGVIQPVVSLSGIWKVSPEPVENFWSNEVDPNDWMDIRVPSQSTWMGMPRDAESYVCKTRFYVPEDFEKKRMYLRFEGVTGTARAWAKGVELEGHQGSFTIWNREITQPVDPSAFAWLTVSVEEPTYANTYRGGILRDVKLVALGQNHLTRLHFDTDLDKNFRDATLKVSASGILDTSADTRLGLTLTAQFDGEFDTQAGPAFAKRDTGYLVLPTRDRSNVEVAKIIVRARDRCSIDGCPGQIAVITRHLGDDWYVVAYQREGEGPIAFA